MAQHRIFAGSHLRALRAARAMRQADLAAALDISASYLSQLENDDRPLTSALIDRLRTTFPVEWQDMPADSTVDLLRAFEGALASSPNQAEHSTAQARRIVEQFPEFARQFVTLNENHQANLKRLEMVDEALGSDNSAGGRLPWEEVRDWFQNTNNYVDGLDRAAELFSEVISEGASTPSVAQLIAWLDHRDIVIHFTLSGPVRQFDAQAKTLTINTAKVHDSLRFHLSCHIAGMAFQNEMSMIVQNAVLRSGTARHLLQIGLVNYMAGAIMMPYGKFREAARKVRHDVDQLRYLFAATFEQVCHRLSTLQRPGARGTPMFFCRVDMAGNITKRHSATRLRFARFGGACPLWVVHEAVAVPDRIHVQLAELPDGVRYVSIAKGLVKQTGSYARTPRRYAVALGCEADFASDFVYSDQLNLASRTSSTLIGESCRICTRDDCDQRAYPPSDKEIAVDVTERDIVPYRILAD